MIDPPSNVEGTGFWVCTLLGQDFWSTDQRSQPVLWPSQSTDGQSQSTDSV